MKYKIFITVLSLFLLPTLVKSEEVDDVEFRAPLFCDNSRNTISYIIASFNIDSFSQVTDLAYFTDGYPNVVGSDFYSASKSFVEANKFRVDLRKLVGTKASQFYPQKSGPLASCVVTISPNWKDKVKNINGVNIFETDDFVVRCTFPLDERKICSSSKPLAKKLYLNNPSNSKELRYESRFTYRTWKSDEKSIQ